MKAGNICSVSVFFVRVGSQISPRRAKKDSNIPSPGRTRSVKCPTLGTTKTIKSPPHALPPRPPAGFTLIGALKESKGFFKQNWCGSALSIHVYTIKLTKNILIFCLFFFVLLLLLFFYYYFFFCMDTCPHGCVTGEE